ncbi:MAG: hypothetical protein ABUS57_10685 [Pseudomonadota bacterium]
MSAAVGGGVYALHRRHVWTSIAAVALVITIALLLTLVVPGAWKWACLAFAGLTLWAVTPSIRMLGDARPVLVVSAEGLLYRPFSDRAAPWSEITAITFTHAYSRFVNWGRVSWKRQTASDQIFFALANYAGYPSGVGRTLMRALQRLTGSPPIIIQLWLVDGEGEAVCAEIAKHWPGQIVTIEQRVVRDGDRGSS